MDQNAVLIPRARFELYEFGVRGCVGSVEEEWRGNEGGEEVSAWNKISPSSSPTLHPTCGLSATSPFNLLLVCPCSPARAIFSSDRAQNFDLMRRERIFLNQDGKSAPKQPAKPSSIDTCRQPLPGASELN
jgi:hypothetical protein